MTEYQIIMNYQQAIAQADKLDKIAQNLSKLSNDEIGDMIGTLKNAWQSDNSPQYYNKVSIVQGDIVSTANNVSKIAQSIRKTAKAVRDAELLALKIAKARTYR